MRSASILFLSTLTTACGHHGGADPTTAPIAAVTADAIYVVNGRDATISVIDAESAAALGTIQVNHAEYPHHLYLSSDGSEMYLAVPGVDLSAGHGHDGGHDAGGHSFVLRLAANTGELLAVASLAGSNHNAIPSPDGKTVWTSQMTEPGTVLILDATTLKPVDEVKVENMPAEVTFAPDGSLAFIANGGSDTVSVIDVATHAVRATIPVGDNPVGAWPGSDGSLYVDNESGRSISAIDPAMLAVTQAYALDFTPAFAAAFAQELWVTDTDGGRVVFYDRVSGTQLGSVATGAGAHAIAFSPDGTRAWISNQGDDTISVLDTATRAVTSTVAVGGAPNGIVFRAAP